MGSPLDSPKLSPDSSPASSQKTVAASELSNRSTRRPTADPLLKILLAEQRDLSAVERFSAQPEKKPADDSSHYRDLIPLSRPAEGEQYAFVVDLDKCTGCKACVTGCHNLNGLDADETWRSVGLLVGGNPAQTVAQYVTTACHHCLEPACLEGCPVNAYEKMPDTGIVRHLDDQCIGCQYCMLRCPYEVPKYNRRLGIVRKCDMCQQRLAVNEAPACVQACPTQAIRIGVVEQERVREARQVGSLVPGAPASSHTLPTTKFNSKKPARPDLLPVDFQAARPHEPHWPLIIMLVLTQLSVGAFTVDFVLNWSLGEGLTKTAGRVHSLVALTLGLLALGASVFHLGRPLYAWRAIIGLRTSWLSREIVTFGGFAGVAVVYAASYWPRLPGDYFAWAVPAATWLPAIQNPAGIALVLIGLAGVICSIMIYGDCPRPLWRSSDTGIRFFGTAAILGTATILTATTAAAWLLDKSASTTMLAVYGKPLCACLVFFSLTKLLWEAAIFRHLWDRTHSAAKRSAGLMTTELSRIMRLRFATTSVGGIILPLIFYGQIPVGAADLPGVFVLCGILFALTVTGEIAERYLFFAAASNERMPGGI